MTDGIPAQGTPTITRMAPTSSLSRADGTTRDVVTVRLPAAPAYLAVLRTTTASLAARLDFTLDEIEDLRIAVDEASALLVANADPAGELASVFELFDDALQVTVSTTAEVKAPARDSFAWAVLSALAGEVDTWRDPDGRQNIALIKHRGREVQL